MGMIFLTSDERPFKKGDYIVSHDITYLPTAPETTYIVYKEKVKEKDILDWIDIVSFRLVFVVDSMPKLSKTTKEKIIIHESLNPKTDSYNKAIQAIWKFNDRQYVYSLLKETNTPIPLAVAWMKANYDSDPQKWRRMADVMFTLPDYYAHAIMAFCVRSDGQNPKWPKGGNKNDSGELPLNIRETDLYGRKLIDSLGDIRNEIRDKTPKEEQTIITKRRENILEWL